MHTKSTLQILAATSGLAEQRIEELWEGADLYARAQGSNPGTAQYSKVMQERMAMLVEREVAKRRAEPDTPWVMADAHLGLICVSLEDALKAFGSRRHHVLH